MLKADSRSERHTSNARTSVSAWRVGGVRAGEVPGIYMGTLQGAIENNVMRGSRISTDELRSYSGLKAAGFDHQTFKRKAKEWARGPVHTNTIEAVWANLKRGISGTHVWVSKKHLSKYLGEFEFSHNLRDEPNLMIKLLLESFASPVARRAP